jgi:SAM-dependent methyltransferase
VDASLYPKMAALEDHHWWFTGRRAVVEAVLSRQLPPRGGRKILDVGCGTGGMLPLLRQWGEVTGIDMSAQALELARQRGGNPILHQGGLPEGLPRGERYDLITAFDVIEHLAEPVASLQAMRGALRPGGVLVCTVPAFAFLWSEHDTVNHHHRRYTKALLKTHLEGGGFHLRWCSFFNSALFPPIALVRLLSKVLPRRQDQAPQDHLSGPPAPVNKLLHAIFSAERFVVPHLPLPVGVSLIAVADVAGSSPG